MAKFKKKNFTVIIPARGGSVEIKNKNLKNINLRPLVAYSINNALNSKLVGDTFVSTDSKRIAKISTKYGAKIILRPKHLGKSNSSIDDVVIHALNYLEKKKNFSIKNIVTLQPTSFFRSHKDIDNAIKFFISKNADSLFSSVNIHPLFWMKTKKKLKPLNYLPTKRVNRQKMKTYLIENGAIYITKKKILQNINSRLGGKIVSYIMDSISLLEIDTKQDLVLTKTLATKKVLKKINILKN